MPRSVQQSIPIDRIYADGVWQSGNVFSRMWQISDINYAMQSDAAKQNILTQLGTLYAGIPADCWMQVCIVSQRMDEKAFAHDVLYHRENDGYDALRAERNRLIKASARENGNVVQHKYIIISTNKTGVKDARERFVQVQGHLLSAFSALECAVTPLDNRARLEVLHKFFRISEEGRYQFDFDNCAKLGQDFRDYVAPDCIKFCKKHIPDLFKGVLTDGVFNPASISLCNFRVNASCDKLLCKELMPLINFFGNIPACFGQMQNVITIYR